MHKDINVNVSGPVQPTSQYKTVVLKGQAPFAAQVTEPNTKYVIKHDFVLDGDVTIPANCVLEFDGGSIINQTVILNNTFLSGTPLINSVLSGTINNNTVYGCWFLTDSSLFNSLNNITGYSQISLENNKEYYQDISVTLKPKTFVLDGNGATIKSRITSGQLLKNTANNYVVRKSVLQAETNSNSIYVSDISDLQINDIIILQDSTDFSWSSYRYYYKQGEYLTIKSIEEDSGNNRYIIKTVENIVGKYDVIEHPNAIFIYKCDNGSITVKNLNIKSIETNNATASIHAIHLFTVKDLIIDNVNIQNFHYSLEVDGIYRGTITNCNITNVNYRFSNNDNYAIAIGNSQDVKIYNCTCCASNHGIAIGGGNEWYNIVNRYIYNENCTCNYVEFSSFDCHGNGEYIYWINCKGYNISTGGSKSFIDGCILYPRNKAELNSYNDRYAIGIRGERSDLNITIKNCIIYGNLIVTGNNDSLPDSYKYGIINIKHNKIYYNPSDSPSQNIIILTNPYSYNKKVSVIIDDNDFIKESSNTSVTGIISVTSNAMGLLEILNNRIDGISIRIEGTKENVCIKNNLIKDSILYCDSQTNNGVVQITDNLLSFSEIESISSKIVVDLQSSLSINGVVIFENNTIRNNNSTLINTGISFVRFANIDKAVYSKNKLISPYYDYSAELNVSHTVNELFIDTAFSSLYKNSSTSQFPLALTNAKRIILTTLPNIGDNNSNRYINKNIVLKDSDGVKSYDTLFDTYRFLTVPYVKYSSGKPKFNNGTNWVDGLGAEETATTNGTFTNKPDASKIYIGFSYFCTSGASIDGGTTEKTNITIYYGGSNKWYDANGIEVVAKA